MNFLNFLVSLVFKLGDELTIGFSSISFFLVSLWSSVLGWSLSIENLQVKILINFIKFFTFSNELFVDISHNDGLCRQRKCKKFLIFIIIQCIFNPQHISPSSLLCIKIYSTIVAVSYFFIIFHFSKFFIVKLCEAKSRSKFAAMNQRLNRREGMKVSWSGWAWGRENSGWIYCHIEVKNKENLLENYKFSKQIILNFFFSCTLCIVCIRVSISESLEATH